MFNIYIYKKKYSIYIYLKYIMNINKEKILKIENVNKIIYIKNNALINTLFTIQNWNKLQEKEKYINWLRRWNKENLIIFNLSKEFLFYRYDFNSYYYYLEHLEHYFVKPISYELKLTNSMRIKSFLWTSPYLVRWTYSPLIELRSLDIRIKALKMSRIRRWIWKRYIKNKTRVISNKLPRMRELTPIYW
jgi:hypothetical protein